LEGLEELSPGCWAQNSVTPKWNRSNTTPWSLRDA
jgi:hypothetical protein